jgi:3-oxoacyl-[acyl-carrier protein] reductase
MVKSALEALGRLDILVNNAAIRDVTTIDDIDYATWKRVTGIILDGAFLPPRRASPRCGRAGRARSSTSAACRGTPAPRGRPHVVAAKLGLVGLTRALAHDSRARPHHGESASCPE